MKLLDTTQMMLFAVNEDDFEFIRKCIKNSGIQVNADDYDCLTNDVYASDRISFLPDFKTFLNYVKTGSLPHNELVYHINDWCDNGRYLNHYGINDNTVNEVTRSRLAVAIWERVKHHMKGALRSFIEKEEYVDAVFYCAIIEFFDRSDLRDLEEELMKLTIND
jgi:hypothetical protein